MAYYVYHLVDPRSNEVFYVGKGRGGRIDAHEREAAKGVDHPKCEVIRQIWADGMVVGKKKVKTFHKECDAYKFEAEEVERIGLENLTNLIPGGGKVSNRGPYGTVFIARWAMEKIARIIQAKGNGYKFSAPWGEVIESFVPNSLKAISMKYGREFVEAELAKYKIKAVYEVV